MCYRRSLQSPSTKKLSDPLRLNDVTNQKFAPTTSPVRKKAARGTNKRFGAPTSPPIRKKATRGVVPANSSKWALKSVTEWAKQRSANTPSDPVPHDLLESRDAALVCKWLCLFVL